MNFPWHTQIFLDAPRLWPVAGAIALIAVVSVARLYIPQIRTLTLPARLVLPTLRSAALIALAASILKPVAVHNAGPSESGEVIFLFDRTASMGARDLAWLKRDAATTQPDRSTESGLSNLVSLADAFGMIAPGSRDPTLTGLRADIEHGQQTVRDLMQLVDEYNLARAAGQDEGPVRIRIATLREQFRASADLILKKANALSKSPLPPMAIFNLDQFAHLFRQMKLDNFAEELDRLAHWTQDAQNDADLKLYQSDESVRMACDKIADLSRYQRVEFALSPRAPTDENPFLNKLPAGEAITAYSVAQTTEPMPFDRSRGPHAFSEPPDGHSTDLIEAAQTALVRAAGRSVQAVVLFSDGGQQGNRSSSATLANPSNIPIFCVDAAAPPWLLKDVSVTDLPAPDCFVGETVTARAQLQSSHLRGISTEVALSIDGRHAATRPAELTDQPLTVEFPINFQKPGVRLLQVSIPAAAEAPTSQNKTAERYIKVMDDKINIGVFAGSPDWDYQYVSNALSRTPWINLSRAILPTGGAPLALTPDEILQLNLLILDDVPISALSRDQWQAVNHLVTDRGGSVLLVAGEENLQRYILHPLTADLLPFPIGQTAVWRDWPGNEPGFHLAPAPGTQSVDALKLIPALSDADADQYWAELPAFFRYLSLPVLKPAARPLLIERDSSSPILVENRVGLGRTFFLGMHETWRWRYKVGERDQDRFWLQLIRYAADEPYAVHVPGVWLDADPISARPMQPIHIRARVVDENQIPSQAPTQTVELWRGDELIKKITMSPVPGGEGLGRYQATLIQSDPGDLQLRLARSSGATPAVLPLHIAMDNRREMADLSDDPQFLRRLAEDSGGEFLRLDQIQSLPQLINRATSSQTRLVQRPIWDSYYLFSFVVGCFGVEWAIRKRVGLA